MDAFQSYYIMALIQGYIQFQKSKVEAIKKWEATVNGTLKSPVKADRQAPRLILGSVEVIPARGQSGPVFSYIADEPIFLKFEDGEAKLTLIVRDMDKKVIATIADNKWFVPNAPSIVLDRNFNENTLEVIDATNEVVLQVQLKGAEIHLAGRFIPLGDGRIVRYRPFLHEIYGVKDSLFKYPSKDNPGVLRVKENTGDS